MATPPRLFRLECPSCSETHWVKERPFVGPPPGTPVTERARVCPTCDSQTDGWTILESSPGEFLMQPSRSYPMTEDDFDHWVSILREHFPDDRRILELGKSFYPITPFAAYALKATIAEARDDEMLLRQSPDFGWARMWLGLDCREPVVHFLHKNGGRLTVTGPREGPYGVTCYNAVTRETVVIHAGTSEAVERLVSLYFRGKVDECMDEMAS